MKSLSTENLIQVTGGEIIPGYPTPEIICTDMKLLVSGARGDPGLDVTAAAKALLKHCGADFWDLDMPHAYIMMGGVTI
jgi:hypothetical protein